MNAHPTDDLAAYAIGVLDAHERPSIARHLEGCPVCRSEARAYAETAWTIAETTGREVPARLRSAVIGDAAGASGRSWIGQLVHVLGRPVPLAVPFALAAVLIIALVGYGSARRDADQYATALSGAVGARVVALAATDASAGVRGSLVIPANGGSAYVILDLPAASPGKTWEAWVIRGDAPVRAGTTDERGVTTLVLATSVGTGDTVAITAEPAGGVDTPTGPVVLVGRT